MYLKLWGDIWIFGRIDFILLFVECEVKKFEIIEESIHPFSFVFQFVTRTIENLIR